MAATFQLPSNQIVDQNGNPRAGAKLEFYSAGTSTPRNVFSNDALTTILPQPVVADASGRFPPIFMTPVLYRVILKTSTDVVLNDWDNVDPGVPIGGGALAIANGGTGATTATSARSNLGIIVDQPFVSVATASTAPIFAANSDHVALTGTITVTAFDAGTAGRDVIVRVTDSFTITAGPNLIIPSGGSSLFARTGDSFRVVAIGSGVSRIVEYNSAASGLVGELNQLVTADPTTGTSTAYFAGTTPNSPLRDGRVVTIILHVANGANPTLNYGGTGAKPLTFFSGAGLANWFSGLYALNQQVRLRYQLGNDSWVVDSPADLARQPFTTLLCTQDNVSGVRSSPTSGQFGFYNASAAEVANVRTNAIVLAGSETLNNAFVISNNANATQGSAISTGGVLHAARSDTATKLFLQTIGNPGVPSQVAIISYNGATVGSITNPTTTTTAFNTSSDYRMKENIRDMTDEEAMDRIKSLRPRFFKWRGYEHSQFGFIAHEVAPVVPTSVTGEKDAVDDNGAILSQGLDAGTPEMIAVLVRSLQSALARIEKLELQVKQ